MTPPSPQAAPTAKTGLRLGPRPLPLHLMAAATAYVTSNAALPLLRDGSMRWSPALGAEAEALSESLAEAKADALAAAVEREGRRRLGAFLTGVERYRRHPYRRDIEDAPAVWASGTTSLRAFGQHGGLPVLLVPSLINRGYILDLSSRRSFARWLAAAGFRPFLVDWGAPADVEREFTLTDYVVRRLEPAFDAVSRLSGQRPLLLGYCMGGLLAVALAQRRPGALRGLALLATPWDFHADRPGQAARLAMVATAMEWPMRAIGELPVDVIQALFASLDPALAERKFSAFAALDPNSDAAQDFVALEDWLNDGVPLAAPVARECLIGWYGANTPALGMWRIAGETVDAAALDLPSLAVVPAHDRIVPPESAETLGRRLPNATVLRPNVGHIGMMVSRGVESALWPRIAAWLRERR